MESLEKIQEFLERLEEERAVDLPRLSVFADGSCSVSGFRATDRIVSARDIQQLLKKIDNYQWDTNTDPAKQ